MSKWDKDASLMISRSIEIGDTSEGGRLGEVHSIIMITIKWLVGFNNDTGAIFGTRKFAYVGTGTGTVRSRSRPSLGPRFPMAERVSRVPGPEPQQV